MPYDFSEMRNQYAGYHEFLTRNRILVEGHQVRPKYRRFTRKVQDVGERIGHKDRAVKRVRNFGRHKKVAKTITATFVVGGIIASPFTGGLSAVASIGLATAVAAAQKTLDVLAAPETQGDHFKNLVNKVRRHAHDSAKHAQQLQNNEVIEDCDDAFDIAWSIFKYAHHMYKFRLYLDHVRQSLERLERQFDNMNNSVDLSAKWQAVDQWLLYGNHVEACRAQHAPANPNFPAANPAPGGAAGGARLVEECFGQPDQNYHHRPLPPLPPPPPQPGPQPPPPHQFGPLPPLPVDPN